MTILELTNEHMPLDLARIVDDYAIRKDWRPAMDEVVDTMNSRGVAAANMMDYHRTVRWWHVIQNWKKYRFDSECERLCSYSHFRDAPNRFDIETQMVKVYTHVLNDPGVDPCSRMSGWFPIESYWDELPIKRERSAMAYWRRMTVSSPVILGYNIPFDFPL